MKYSKKVLKHFHSPGNVGKMKDPDAVGRVGNMKCGDIMEIYLKVEKGKIKDISFLTYGCVSAIATSDVLCDLAKGKTLKQAEKLTYKDITKKLGGLPAFKIHCSVLGISALRKSIENYKKKRKN